MIYKEGDMIKIKGELIDDGFAPIAEIKFIHNGNIQAKPMDCFSYVTVRLGEIVGIADDNDMKDYIVSKLRKELA